MQVSLMIPLTICGGKFDFWLGVSHRLLGGVHKLRLQDEVGKWSKNVHFL